MKVIELDLTGCETVRDIHERIRVAFEFPEWYGANWSAFWDLLWSDCDADKVVVKGVSTLSEEVGKQLSVMYEILERNKALWANSESPFDYEVV